MKNIIIRQLSFVIVPAFITVFFLSACAESTIHPAPVERNTSAATPIPLSDLYGSVWRLEHSFFTDYGILIQDVMTLKFDPDGLSGIWACNDYRGQYASLNEDGASFSIRNFNLTQEECDSPWLTEPSLFEDAVSRYVIDPLQDESVSWKFSVDIDDGELQKLWLKDRNRVQVFVPLPSVQLYLMQERPLSELYDIERVEINEDILMVRVSDPACFSRNTFELSLTIPIELSESIPITLSSLHDSRGYSNARPCSRLEAFDLTPLKEHYREITGDDSGELELVLSNDGGTNRLLYKF